jgi:hypothetical protein
MDTFKNFCITFSINHYKSAACVMLLFTITMCAFISRIVVDTDPENMLPTNDPKRMFHNQTKQQFSLSEIVVVGIINEHDPDGVFNPDTLKRVYELTEFAKTLCWKDSKNSDRLSGVIEADMMAPSLIDHMSQGSPGEIRFQWLMPRPPNTREEAKVIRDRAFSNPMLKGRLFSEDGKVICIYLPLTDKHLSYRINMELNKKIKALGGDEEYHIAGVPVAEVAIGVEMFSQMSVGSSLSMIVIFSIMLFFFRKFRLVILPMFIAMFSVLSTMGLMISFGFPVHILSSMLPIFLMTIAMVDSVHVLSEFFDVYTHKKGRKKTIQEVMNTLFVPIFYTSVTTAAGFASLMFTPIPPAQVFGAFLSIGVMIAWLYTIIFVPAYIMMIPKKGLHNFGMTTLNRNQQNLMSNTLHAIGFLTQTRAKLILSLVSIVIGIAIWGITHIHVNDNYAKRFVKTHPIRKADMALNKHIDGTYTAYLVLEGKKDDILNHHKLSQLSKKLHVFAIQIKKEFRNAPELSQKISEIIPSLAIQTSSYSVFLNKMIQHIDKYMKGASDEDFYVYDEFRTFIGVEKESLKIFKRPDVLKYMLALQKHMEQSGVIGKSTSIVDVVRKVNQEMIDGKPENYRIPDKLQSISECCFQFQQGHRPNDLWHMITPDYMKANIWMQLKSGDSSAMKRAVKEVDAYLDTHTPPVTFDYEWAGLHYINLVLQDKLIPAMIKSFLGSFLVVFIMMSALFRSIRWGLLCMAPLSITILLIYGIVGISGKDYDLPIAVLGVLTIGMAVDFAIHFLQRSKDKYNEIGTWKKSGREMFGEPARAIARNVLVIAIGFLPLLIAPLVPYKTMGIMLFVIMTLSGLITLLILPSVLTTFERSFFHKNS